MAVDPSTMSEIISNVFDEMLAMPTSEDGSSAEALDSQRVVASIRISGAAEELIVVEAPMATASLIGANMFDAEAEALEEEEIHDAVGEIANMIGGNVKGLYDGDSSLSLPCISTQPEPPAVPAEAEQTVVNVSGQPMLVYWKDMQQAATATP